jgi:hypothetical protein
VRGSRALFGQTEGVQVLLSNGAGLQAVDFVSKPASREDLMTATVKAGIELGWIDRWLPPGALEDMKALDG